MKSGSKGNHSAPGAWPYSQSGKLKGSIDSRVTDNSVTIGTNTPYSLFLRHGTSKMARRKMSDDALREGMKHGRLGKWVEWVRG
jgi:phage gpG-like protein